ncbi:MAG: zf-HC2 domain-containing protein [Gemmatimonadaceae bacterium]
MQHPDDGTIQGWLEGQLPAAEAREVASHVAACGECQGLAAEIRGLMARTSGIVAALDGEGAVQPAVAPVPGAASTAASSGRARRRPVVLRRWAPALAAAAVVLVVMRQASSRDDMERPAEVAARGAAPAPVAAPARGATDLASRRQAPSPLGDEAVRERPGFAASAPLPGGAGIPTPVPAPAPPRVAATAPASPGARPAAAPVAAPEPAAAPAPAPAPIVTPSAASRLRMGDAVAKAQRATAFARAEDSAMNLTLTGCYRVISRNFSRMILEAGSRALVVDADTTVGRWSPTGDSIAVRWHDSLAVFPAGVARTVGRYGVAGGESRPLTVWRGCPAP